MPKNIDIRVVVPGSVDVKQVDTTNFESTYNIIKNQVDGYLDVVAVDELDIWVDDEGLLKNLQPSILIKRSKKDELTNQDILLVGTAVFTSHDEEGDTIGLTDNAIKIIEEMKPAIIGMKPVLLLERYID